MTDQGNNLAGKNKIKNVHELTHFGQSAGSTRRQTSRSIQHRYYGFVPTTRTLALAHMSTMWTLARTCIHDAGTKPPLYRFDPHQLILCLRIVASRAASPHKTNKSNQYRDCMDPNPRRGQWHWLICPLMWTLARTCIYEAGTGTFPIQIRPASNTMSEHSGFSAHDVA